MTQKIKPKRISGLAGLALAASLALGTAQAQENNIRERVILDNANEQLHSETLVTGKSYRALVDIDGGNNKAGININTNGINANLGYGRQNNEDIMRGFLRAQRNNVAISGSYQEKGEDKLWETAVEAEIRDASLEAELTSARHISVLGRNPINKDNQAGLGASLSTTDGNYHRYGAALSHSGKVGFLAYAIIGENEDASKHRDIRIRGGLGGKTGAGSIGAWSTQESCFWDEDIVEDVTDPFFTGNFCNYAAKVRGDPIGFDVRYCNGTYSAQVAAKTGALTTMPKVSYNEDTHDRTFDLEAQLQLSKNVSLVAQNRTGDNKTPGRAAMVVFQKRF